MKKIFLQFKINSSIYIICYAVKTFIIWEFTNPFEWIINMGTYDPSTRGGILLFYVIFNGFAALVIWNPEKENQSDTW